jgi:DNA-binding response OmpR family regulator
MASELKKRRTILLFGTDHEVFSGRARALHKKGYHVLNASNGFEAIKLAAKVDAVVLDMHRNSAEVGLVATEIKWRQPQVPTILLTEDTIDVEGVRTLADVLVPKRDNLEMLVTALESVLLSGGKTSKLVH